MNTAGGWITRIGRTPVSVIAVGSAAGNTDPAYTRIPRRASVAVLASTGLGSVDTSCCSRARIRGAGIVVITIDNGPTNTHPI